MTSTFISSIAFQVVRRCRRVIGACSLTICLVGCGGSDGGPPDAAQRFLEAQEAIARGDNAAALASLQASIDANPNTWAYMERLKINAKQGADAAVEEDVQAILKLNPENRDVAWIRTEMKKPAAARFDAAAKPPSATK
jgi:hypothetical protein